MVSGSWLTRQEVEFCVDRAMVVSDLKAMIITVERYRYYGWVNLWLMESIRSAEGFALAQEGVCCDLLDQMTLRRQDRGLN